MKDVIKWLESPEGECWSRKKHNNKRKLILLVCIKDDLSSKDLDIIVGRPVWVA